MSRFRNYVVIGAGFALVATVIGAFSAAPVVAQVIRAALVKNVDEPGRVPYQSWSDSLQCGAGGCALSGFPAVPAGKRLVITYVNGVFLGPAPVSTFHADLVSSIGVTGGVAFLPAATETDTFHAVNTVTHVYMEEGLTPFLILGPGFMSASASITGYLVDKSI